jgi:hypothetical protein
MRERVGGTKEEDDWTNWGGSEKATLGRATRVGRYLACRE